MKTNISQQLQFIDLTNAIEQNDIEAFNELIRNNPSLAIFKTKKHGRTALLNAAQNGFVDGFKPLLEAGANVNSTTIDGETPLCIAAINVDSKAVRELLNANADVNLARNDGATPLCIAASNGDSEAVIELLNAKADVSLAIKNGVTPLHAAAGNGRLEVVCHLIKKLSNSGKLEDYLNKKDTHYRTPLFYAAINGHSNVVLELLNAGADPDVADIDKLTPLDITTADGYAEVVEHLINTNKIDLNKKNIDKMTPLYNAVYCGHLDVVLKLLNAGADANLTYDYDGTTPLHLAAENGHSQIVKALLAKDGIEINKASNNGSTPLLIATKCGHTQVVEQLIAAQADVNAKNQYSETPLSLSLYSNVLSKRLLLAGADLILPKNEDEKHQFFQALKTINIERLSPTELSNIKHSGCYSLIKLLQLKVKDRKENETLNQNKLNLFSEIFSYNRIKIESLKSPILLEIIERADLTPIQKINIFQDVAQNPDKYKNNPDFNTIVYEYIVGKKPQSSPSGKKTGSLIDSLSQGCIIS